MSSINISTTRRMAISIAATAVAGSIVLAVRGPAIDRPITDSSLVRDVPSLRLDASGTTDHHVQALAPNGSAGLTVSVDPASDPEAAGGSPPSSEGALHLQVSGAAATVDDGGASNGQSGDSVTGSGPRDEHDQSDRCTRRAVADPLALSIRSSLACVRSTTNDAFETVDATLDRSVQRLLAAARSAIDTAGHVHQTVEDEVDHTRDTAYGYAARAVGTAGNVVDTAEQKVEDTTSTVGSTLDATVEEVEQTVAQTVDQVDTALTCVDDQVQHPLDASGNAVIGCTR